MGNQSSSSKRGDRGSVRAAQALASVDDTHSPNTHDGGGKNGGSYPTLRNDPGMAAMLTRAMHKYNNRLSKEYAKLKRQSHRPSAQPGWAGASATLA